VVDASTDSSTSDVLKENDWVNVVVVIETNINIYRVANRTVTLSTPSETNFANTINLLLYEMGKELDNGNSNNFNH
jgi:hypothetical protein